jgi:hypothetical protein
VIGEKGGGYVATGTKMSLRDLVIEEYNRQQGDAPAFVKDIVAIPDYTGLHPVRSGLTQVTCDGDCGFVWEPKHLREIDEKLLCWPCSMAWARRVGICLDASVWGE